MRKWFKGVFAGGLIGLVAGLLLAPTKGEETREKVSKVTADLNERMKQLRSSAKETVEGIAEKAKTAFGGNNKTE